MLAKVVSATAVALMSIMGGTLFQKDRLHRQFEMENDFRSARALVPRMRRMHHLSLLVAVAYLLLASSFATFVFFFY